MQEAAKTVRRSEARKTDFANCSDQHTSASAPREYPPLTKEKDIVSWFTGSAFRFSPSSLPQQALRHLGVKFRFRDLNGKTHDLTEYRGKTVVLNFWGTWCHGCVEELPTFQHLFDSLKNAPNVTFLFVSQMDSPDKVKQFVTKSRYTLPFYLIENDTVPKALDGQAWPSTFLFGPDGTLRGRFLGGANWADESVIRSIKKLERGEVL